ncbi:hypothetical protein LY78DRAFT_654475 [Colletotrichum sublineola]|nr:hypothetical protein LY78DRAFT_654475 [Colletotrichum sublineola]
MGKIAALTADPNEAGSTAGLMFPVSTLFVSFLRYVAYIRERPAILCDLLASHQG